MKQERIVIAVLIAVAVLALTVKPFTMAVILIIGAIVLWLIKQAAR